ncbi:MAG: glucose-6-phosphate dehydrogenase assembly protein OpcA [Pyrinomonadaceae bacterium]
METQTHESTAAVSVAGVDVGKLEKELAAMWLPATNEDGTTSEAGVTRVCVLNLVVYAAHQEDRAEVDKLLDDVTEQTPSRAILLVADRDSTDAKLEAYVSTRCQVSGKGAKQVCGEQITIEASGSALETASTAIEPLLVPDVPVFLWWKDIPHYEDKLFSRLVGLSDRVVIDSLAFDHPHEDLLRLAEMIRTDAQHMLVSDLNWGRLTAWRTLLASFWDVAEYRPLLDQIDTVIAEYDPPDVAPDQIAAQASLVVGWLASRLGWQFLGDTPRVEGDAKHFTAQALGGRTVNVEFRAAVDRAGHDGLLAALTLRAGDAAFSVSMNETGTKLETQARLSDTHEIERVLAYEQKSEGQRLSRELGFRNRDKIYEATVDAAAHFLAALAQR